ncbi:MAG: hypothetical protein ABIN74_12800, partial [Ferruginibacter sp.]
TNKQSNISQLLFKSLKTNIALESYLIEKPTRSKVKNQYPAYAFKSDDGKKPKKNQYPAYALKSDDGERPKKNQYPAYALKSDDGNNEEH